MKFANNEPWRPYYKASQINVFVEELRGAGVQHLAIAVKDIIPVRARAARARPRLHADARRPTTTCCRSGSKKLGVGSIDEDIAVLRELEILVDGDGPGKLPAADLPEGAAGLYSEAEAGPFFFEIIQRKGDQGFGAGNFRALFESIERAQEGQLQSTK